MEVIRAVTKYPGSSDHRAGEHFPTYTLEGSPANVMLVKTVCSHIQSMISQRSVFHALLLMSKDNGQGPPVDPHWTYDVIRK